MKSGGKQEATLGASSRARSRPSCRWCSRHASSSSSISRPPRPSVLKSRLDRQIGGLSTLENLSRIDTGLTINIRNISSVAHQPTGLGFDAGDPHSGQRTTGGEQRNLAALAGKKGIRTDDHCARPVLDKRCESAIEIVLLAGPHDKNFHA